MADNWDDSDDDWDKSDDEIDKRLGLAKIDTKNDAPVFDDEEEDLLVKEKEANEKASKVTLKAKGSALAQKKVRGYPICYHVAFDLMELLLNITYSLCFYYVRFHK